jgi:hypothetical protein
VAAWLWALSIGNIEYGRTTFYFASKKWKIHVVCSRKEGTIFEQLELHPNYYSAICLEPALSESQEVLVAYQINGWWQRKVQDVTFYEILDVPDLTEKLFWVRTARRCLGASGVVSGIGDTDIAWDMLDGEVTESVMEELQEWISGLT